MKHELERPNVNDPFSYNMKMDESTLLLVMDAMNTKYNSIDYAISQHAECNRLSDDGCRVYKETYGTSGSCFNELDELHSQAQTIIAFIRDARFVRENREVKSVATFRAMEEEARKIRETALRTLESTGHYNILTDVVPQGEGERVPTQRIPSSLETHAGKVELTDEQMQTAERVGNGLREQLRGDATQ